MFLKMNIWDRLDEYGIFMFWGAVFICMLINKSTRKLACKILFGILIFAVIVFVIFFTCIQLFGTENGFITGFLVLFNLIILVMVYMSVDELHRVIRLNKKGIHTYGTLISRATARGVSYVVYIVDGKKYECKSESQLNKYEIGFDKVPVIYDAENHKNSCVKKYDFIKATELIIFSGILEAGMIGITVYMCRHIFP